MTRGLRTIGLALVGGLLVGCGAGSTPYSDATAGQEQVRLRSILHEQPALPDGFSARAREAWKSPFKASDKNCRAVLESATGRPPQRALQAKAAASYQGDVLGELAAVGLASYAGGEAEWHLQDLGQALGKCSVVTSPGAGGGTELAVSELKLGELGDEVVSRQLRGRLNGYPYALNLVLVRSGGTLVTVVHTGLAKVDAKRTRQLADVLVGMAGQSMS